MTRRVHYGWVVLAATLVVLVTMAGFRSTVGVLVDPLREEFGWTTASISLAAGLNLLLYGLRRPVRGGPIRPVRAPAVRLRRRGRLDPPGSDGLAVGPGVWETSGIIDTSDLFGAGTWLFDVQAHSPTAAPAPNTVEDGQLLVLRRAG